MPKPATPAVHRDPRIMSGAAVFVGTRVPFQTLLDYLEASRPHAWAKLGLQGPPARPSVKRVAWLRHARPRAKQLDEFLDDFPSVQRSQAVRALEQAKEALLAHAGPSHAGFRANQ